MSWAAVLIASTLGSLAETSKVQFNRDIRPILSENCFHCHGPDPGSRKAGLRLDTQAGINASTKKKGTVVVPGHPEQSELWARIVTHDKDDAMPPEESHKSLKDSEKKLVQDWIAEGAPWQPHWSFIKPSRPAVPIVKNEKWVRNPIDAFVAAKLDEKHLSPAPEADRRVLARRLALDLTGLPPEPADVEAFVADTSRDYYEHYVDKLMNSPQWGEHRGRYWLDAARYADTHGLHFDNYREMWPYREWVIQALNNNLPFDQFTLWQLAGDLLPEPTEEELIASGFHRCNITTNEGGTIEDENLANYARDRVETTSWVWLGLTANCAVCHDHKFDPLPTREFYSMTAFFRNTAQGGFDGNVKDSNPSMLVITDRNEQHRWDALQTDLETSRKNISTARTAAEKPFEKWVTGFKPGSFPTDLIERQRVFNVPLVEGQGKSILVTSGSATNRAELSNDGIWTNTGRLGPALSFPGEQSVSFPDAGDFDTHQAFSYGSWVYVPEGLKDTAAVMARMDEGDSHRGWDLWYEYGRFATHIISKWPEDALKVRTRGEVAKKGQWQHVLVSYDGSGKAEGVRIYVNGSKAETDTDVNKLTGSIRTKTPFRLAQRSTGAHFTDGALQDVRIYSRAIPAGEAKLIGKYPGLKGISDTAFADWKKEVRDDCLGLFLPTYKPFKDAEMALAAFEKERDEIKTRNPVTHIQREKKDTMPMARVLFRGQYDQPKDKVEPAVFSALNPLPPNAPKNRLGLAQWILSPENPLTARVTVNRFWQEVFGTGIVKTSEDFGIVGEPPSNQELLDWLAVEFRESGWDIKHLFRLIVTSSAYRQSAQATPEKIERDPGNRYLSRGPRFRMDAEMVRDYALSASGMLVKRIGGPSVKPYQPDNVWEPVAMPESNTKSYKRDPGEGLYRRSLYTFWKRAAPPALMDVFNAPNREVSCLRRERTDTPLQALATLNDPQFMESARHLAEWALRAKGSDHRQALDFVARRIMARPLNVREGEIVQSVLDRSKAYYDANPEEARKLASVGDSGSNRNLPAAEVAALTMTVNQLLNLDEVLNK
ncbi:MAG TPA: DUF1553 domain-containing protein [Candidatus Limnocylindria bacterium]|nr:DUF1553 domain-containing protein [Candidatus Limnocylindria bacterium]